MNKVPDRFLGYAFCVGDVLFELDLDFNIVRVDGAVKSSLGSTRGKTADNFLTMLSEKDRGVISSAAKMLTGANRLGPFIVELSKQGAAAQKFAVFMAKLPTSKDKIYLVLSRPYRLGLGGEDVTPAKVEEKKQQFFDRLESLFEGDPEAQEKMLVTILEAGGEQALDNAQRRNLEEHIRSFSVGGNHAAMVGDGKFAFVHERGAEGEPEKDYAAVLGQTTGIPIQAATIDAQEAHLSEKDSMKALVFSLQNFARGEEGSDLQEMQKNYSSMIGETTERVKDFRRVLEEGAFALVFQPVVNLITGTMHHYEALTRFDLPPSMKSQWEMIRFAEEVGLIDDFDQAVVNRAISKLREMIREGNAIGIAVNLSGRSLSSADFMLELVSVLRGNKDLRQHLSLEITESAQIEDLEALGKVLKEIRDIGFKVYLDDFGAGAAGFQYLKKLKVDALKIDGAYIRDATNNKEDRAFLRSMVTLCKDLGIETVGEWVETKEHADLLKSIGVDFGQGYYFGKPESEMAAAVPGAKKAAG